MNTFGKNLRLTTFGESHGPAMGGIIDGLPGGFKIDFERVQQELDRRRPGKNQFTTARNEPDKPEWLSGLTPEGVTLGSPLAFIIRNRDARSKDYKAFNGAFRPNHADYTYYLKYGFAPQPGGGRSSARETVNWVTAGAIARQLIEQQGVKVSAALTQVGETKIDLLEAPNPKKVYASPVYCPNEAAAEQMMAEIAEVKAQGDSIGGRVTCFITGLPAGLGDPIFGKLHARLAEAMMTINAAKGFEYGLGFAASSSRGSETADRLRAELHSENQRNQSYQRNRAEAPSSRVPRPAFLSNHSGGIQGGISNGQPIYFNVAFKPTPTLMRDVESVNALGEEVLLAAAGRHDPCVAVRAVPVVEAMACLLIADLLL